MELKVAELLSTPEGKTIYRHPENANRTPLTMGVYSVRTFSEKRMQLQRRSSNFYKTIPERRLHYRKPRTLDAKPNVSESALFDRTLRTCSKTTKTPIGLRITANKAQKQSKHGKPKSSNGS